MRGRFWNDVLGLLIFMVFRIDSLLYSLPVWITLILHFVIGLSIKWFWALIILWFISGLLRYFLIMFGRWGANSQQDKRTENKNPYSAKSDDYLRK